MSVREDEFAGLLAEFRARSQPLGVGVDRVPDSRSAAAASAAWTRDLGAEHLALADQLRQRAPGFVLELESHGIEVQPAAQPEVIRDTPAGASLALMAIAETGSALLAEPTLADRSIGMLCLSQLIVCPTDALAASLDDAAPLLRRIALAGGGSYATLVTGPSRTADIERVLTVGVQGPGKVQVVFVDELS